jgi:hypothetical protein
MRRALVAAPLVAVLLVLSAQAGATKPQAKAVKQTSRQVLTIALDGPRVAYVSGGRVYVWNVTTGATSAIKGKYPSNGRGGGKPGIDHQVAIAGTRVALITRFSFGNYQETAERLYVAPVGGWAHQLGPVYRHSISPGSGLTFGSCAAGPVGSGTLLAVSTWNSENSVSFNERLRLVTPTGLRTIVTGAGAIVAESAAGGRIAVLVPVAPPTVGIYSAKGTLLREIAPSIAREIVLSGNRLIVLTWTNTLEVYDWTTGALLHTWPIAATAPNRRPGHLAVYGRLAVYAVDPSYAAPRRLHLLDLTTGEDVVIGRASGGGYASHDAAIGPRGLVYVVNYTKSDHGQRPHGKLVFVPMAKLFGMVS